MKKLLCLFFVLLLIAYGIFSFINYDLNPANWEPFQRGVTAFFPVLFCFMYWADADARKKATKNKEKYEL